MDRIDEFLLRMNDVERNIVGRLSQQDIRLVRLEDEQRAIHRRIDDHMEREEEHQATISRERTAQINGIHAEIKNLSDGVKAVSGAEALNTGWRLWIDKTARSFGHFLQWAVAVGLLTWIWNVLHGTPFP